LHGAEPEKAVEHVQDQIAVQDSIDSEVDEGDWAGEDA
jgi:hypothetical protein